LKLTLEEYSSWMTKELDQLVKPTTTKGQKLLDESNRALGEARGYFEDLAKKGDRDMAGKRDPVSYRAARLVGHSAREASQTLSKVEPPQEVAWDNLKAFKDSLSGVSRSLRDIRSRTVAQLSGFYILDMRSFSGVNDRIAKQSERLLHFLEGDGSSLQKARTLTSVLSDVQNARKEMYERKREANSLAQSREALASQSAALSAELVKLENNGLVSELLTVEKNLRSESRHFRTENLAHLKRPLRRLRDLSVRGEVPLGLDEREALGLYIQSPYRSFLSSKAGPHLQSILENLRGALGSGKLGFKPRKAARVLAQLEQLTSTGELLVRQTEGRSLLARRRRLLQDSNCRSMYELRKQTLEKLETVKSEATEVQAKQFALDEKSALLSTRIQELLMLLETRTKQYTGKEVQVERTEALPVSPR